MKHRLGIATSAEGSAPLCPKCGAADRELSGFGPVRVVADDDFYLLQSLMTGGLDNHRCPVCHYSHDVSPSIFVAIGARRILYCLGTIAQALDGGVRRKVLGSIANGDLPATACDSLDALRDQTTDVLLELVAEINAAIERIGDPEGVAQIMRDWQRLTASHFAAAALVATTPLDHATVVVDDEWNPSGFIDTIARLQVVTWIAMCHSWRDEPSDGRRFEDDLRRYAAPGAFLHQAAELFIENTEANETISHSVYFAVQALRATLLAFLKRENPGERAWADLYVETEMALRSAGDQAPALLQAMRLTPERARLTLTYQALFDACARFFAQHGRAAVKLIDKLGADLGYPKLGAELLTSVRAMPEPDQKLTVKQLLEALRPQALRKRAPDAVLNAARWLARDLLKERDATSLHRLASGLAEILGGGPSINIQTNIWLARLLNEQGDPKAALDVLSDEVAPWERDLPLDERGHLWTERAVALRSAGRADAACELIEMVIADLCAAGRAAPATLQSLLALVYRDLGRHEDGLALLTKTLAESDPTDRALRITLLSRLAGGYAALGRPDQALAYQQEATELQQGPFRASRAAAQARLAAVKAASGQHDQAIEILLGLSLDDLDDSDLLAYGSAWLQAQHGSRLEDTVKGRLVDLFQRLERARKTSYERDDIRLHLELVRLLAVFVEILPAVETNPYWELLEIGARTFEGHADPAALLALARRDWRAGDLDAAREKLLAVPDAVTARFGRGRDVSLRAGSTVQLRKLFDDLASLIAQTPDSLADLRILGEARRDLLGRVEPSEIAQAAAPKAGFFAPTEEAVKRLPGPLAVLEWIEDADHVYGLMTVISAEGGVLTTDVGAPDTDLDVLGARIRQRLANWYPRRKGDPFDLPAWWVFQDWLRQALAAYLPEGGRLVVLPHGSLSGLPCHVAAAPTWRTVYVPSWSALLRLMSLPAAAPNGPLGLALVPRYGETPAVLEALAASAKRLEEMASRLGHRLDARRDAACDASALAELLATTAVLKLLCHGFVDPDDQVVALMIAHDGTLPLADSVAAATDRGRRHRFGWRECQTLDCAPTHVFSAACSTGVGHAAGLSEQLSLFSTLRRLGTRALVAPRWDIVADRVLPILDQAMDRFLAGRIGLGDALHETCADAEADVPRWLAWALAVEGDWR